MFDSLIRQGQRQPDLPSRLGGTQSRFQNLLGVAANFVVTQLGEGFVVRERVERRQVVHLFSRFVRPKIAELIWTRRDEFMRGDEMGRPRSRWGTVTTLMADLEGYTGLTETMDAYVLIGWVDEFMQRMAELIERHDGVVDDYAGDAIKASFGFPIPPRDEAGIRSVAASAVRCALAMGCEIERLNEEWRKRDLPPGRARIGICTGLTVIGAIGGDESLKYTAIGDPVNTASRLESFDKDSFRADADGPPWRILINEETLGYLDGEFRTVDLGQHELRGKTQSTRIHRVLSASEGADERPIDGRES